MRLRGLAAAAIAGLLLAAGPAAAQNISRLGLGLVIGSLSGAVDTIGAPASAAYSFRLLKSSYAGKAVQLRRASDNAVLDIGFTAGGDFDTAAATTHCNATSCFIATWYDQSGNARDGVQATAANQPAFIFNCNGTLPCGRVTTGTQRLQSANVTPATGKGSLSVVARRAVGTGGCYLVTNNGSNAINTSGAGFWGTTDAVTAVTAAATDGAWHAAAGVINAAASFFRIDGGADVGGTIAGSVAAGPVYTMLGGASTTCEQTEAIVWDNYALTLAERQNVTANQIAYWIPQPLDTFATPAAAYSLRKLKSTYSGPAIRLRRASDNAEQDINFLGFVPGLGAPLDVAAANAHCAATSCSVAIWYDQGGAARDAVQATPANQPAFVFNCNGTLPCARSTGTAMLLATAANFTPSAVSSLAGVARRPAGTGNCLFVTTDTTNNVYLDLTPNWYLSSGGSPVGIVGVANGWGAAVGVINGASSFLRVNASENTGPITAVVTAAPIKIAVGPTTPSTCDQTEAIVWDNYALTPAERTALTANQRSFWGF